MRRLLLLLAGLAAPVPKGIAHASDVGTVGVTSRAESHVEAPEVDFSRVRPSAERLVAPTRTGQWAELTLDPVLQEESTRLLEAASPRAGAIVAVDLATGRVLVWSERRGSRGGSVLATARVPAASVFKLVTTAALFERTSLGPSERVCIAGGMHVIERRHLEPPRGGEIHCAPFFQALGHSRNAAYAQLATHQLLRADLVEVAERIGFNGNVPFDFSVPVGELDVPYGDLAFARTAAGFQGSTLSPLGGAYLAAVVASGGVAPRLRIVARAGPYAAPDELETAGRVLNAATAGRLARMMEVTVDAGTAHAAFHDDLGHPRLRGVRVAGKTGTLRQNDADGAASWFVGFAPSRSPRVAVSVLLENSTVWRRKAAEVARDVLRAYFAPRAALRADTPGR